MTVGVPKNGWGLGGGEAPKMFLHKIHLFTKKIDKDTDVGYQIPIDQ
jgi:hypothetical protein